MHTDVCGSVRMGAAVHLAVTAVRAVVYVWQCLRQCAADWQCAALCGSVMRQCGSVMRLSGSARGSVRQSGSVHTLK
jgi:hypothetical protein